MVFFNNFNPAFQGSLQSTTQVSHLQSSPLDSMPMSRTDRIVEREREFREERQKEFEKQQQEREQQIALRKRKAHHTSSGKTSFEKGLQLLNPIKAIEHIIHHPQQIATGLETIGGGLEILGAITGQPEIAFLGLGLTTTGGIIEKGGKIHDKIRGRDLGGVISGLGELGTQLAGISLLEEEENSRLQDLSAKLGQVGSFITDVEQKITTTNELLEQEIKEDITNNEQMKQFIQENHGQNEAIKHGQVVLDKELQALETEVKREEDVLNQIRTDIDTPISNFDFIKDVENFNEPKAILEYLAENLNQLQGIDMDKLDAILDLAIGKGVLTGI